MWSTGSLGFRSTTSRAARSATHAIRRGDPGGAAEIAEFIAEAFHPLDIAHWLIGDDEARAGSFPACFRIFIDHALTHGVIDTTGDGLDAALWAPVTGRPARRRNFDVRMAAVCAHTRPDSSAWTIHRGVLTTVDR